MLRGFSDLGPGVGASFLGLGAGVGASFLGLGAGVGVVTNIFFRS